MNVASAGGFFRDGVFSATGRWPFFPTITAEHEQASDHAAVWAEIKTSPRAATGDSP